MKLNANCVLMTAKVYTLVNLHGTSTLAARSTFGRVYRQGINTSFIAKHQDSHHSGQEPEYKAKVVTRTRDCLSR